MNAIVICLDTLRWDALGCYNNWVLTPEIDAFAKTATRLDAAFCGSFPTVPMRVDSYTGDVNWPRYGWKCYDANQPVLPELLREAGYYTSIVLDTNNNIKAGLGEPFDECHFIKKDVDDGVEPENIPNPVPPEHMRDNGRGFRGDRANWSHYRHERDWFVARTMQRACDWLEDNRARDKFFLWVDTFEIHEDWHPPAHYIEMYQNDYTGPDYSYPCYGYTDIYKPENIERLRARYAAEVSLTDRWVGHLLHQIDLLDLADKTAIILVSDHGMYIGEHQRAGKHTMTADDPWPLYDTVARIPALVRVPGIDGPASLPALTQAADIFSTVLDTCDVDGPPVAGKSWLPLLRGETDAIHDAVFTSCYSGDGPGRIQFLTSLITVNTSEHTGIFGPDGRAPELYDRLKDPEQKTNIAADQPAIVEILRTKLVNFMVKQGAQDDYINAYARGK